MTVLLPFYNSEHTLKEAIVSVHKQKYKFWKLILIDDGSTDKSVQVIKPFLTDARVTLLKNEENKGKSYSLNRALQLVDTPYIIELDSDDCLTPNTLSILYNEVKKTPEEVAVLSGNIQFILEKENKSFKKIKKGFEFQDKYHFLLQNQNLWPRFYKTHILREVGGWPTYDPNEGRYADSLAILLKLLDQYSFHWIDEVMYQCRLNQENTSDNREKVAESVEYWVKEALVRWGNQYEPEFILNNDGWKEVKEILPVQNVPAKNKSPLVTIVIPSYNPGEYIEKALESVINQTYEYWEIIIVDDHSDDQSLIYIQKYLKDPRIKLYKNEKNLGQSKTMNQALKFVKTPYFLQLDADDWLPRHALERFLIESTYIKDTVAVISGNIKYVWRKKDRNGVERTVRRMVKKGRGFINKYDFILANTSVWPRFYRTDAVKKVGGWPVDDPYEGRYCEDIAMLYKLIQYYQFHWIDDVLYYHRRHTNNLTNNIKAHEVVKRKLVNDALIRWGNKYKAVYVKNEEGWLNVRRLDSI